MKMSKNLSVDCKKKQIRNNLRKLQLQNFYQEKRRVLLLQLNNQQMQKQQNLTSLYLELTHGCNITESLVSLLNLLASEKPFDRFDQENTIFTQQIAQNYCLKLTELILTKIYPRYKSQNRYDLNHRISCINVILNLLAEKACPNNSLFTVIMAHIKQTYHSIEIWGVNQQIIEVGYMIGNLIRKDVITGNNQKQIEHLMEWIEQLICISNLDMIYALYKGLNCFWLHFDELFNTHTRQSPQKFKIYRINQIQKTVLQNTNPNFSPKTLNQVFIYLSTNIFTLMTSNAQQICFCAINNAFAAFGTTSNNLFTSICHFVKSCTKELKEINYLESYEIERIKFFNHRTDQMRSYVIKHFIKKILINLCVKDIKMKLTILNLIQSLFSRQFSSISNEQLVSNLIQQGIEDIISRMGQAKQTQLIYETIILIQLFIQHSNQRQLGQKCIHFLQVFQNSHDKLSHQAQDVLLMLEQSHPNRQAI